MMDAYLEVKMNVEFKRVQGQSSTTIIVTYLCKPGNEIEVY